MEENADEATRIGSDRFFKENEKAVALGVKTVLVRKIANQVYSRIKHLPKKEIFGLCEELWRSPFLEEDFVACDWSYGLRKQYLPDDFAVFEKWTDCYVDNWASCDTLCNHTVGTLVEMYPELVEPLKGWADSANRWMKRAAAMTLIIPARRGLFLKEIFEIADRLLADPDDLVQKGYGWMLKAASEAHQDEVFEFVTARRATMPRTAYRYAIEKMPPERRAEAMKKP